MPNRTCGDCSHCSETLPPAHVWSTCNLTPSLYFRGLGPSLIRQKWDATQCTVFTPKETPSVPAIPL